MNRILIDSQDVKYKVFNGNSLVAGPVDKVTAEQIAYKMLMENNITVNLVPVGPDGNQILLG
jgi:hypothetical protein